MRVWIALRLLLGVWAAVEVRCSRDGPCPRKALPPGVLVLAPGSELILDCSGDVTVNGTRLAPATGTYQRERNGVTAKPAIAGTYQRETGGPTIAGTYQRETGEPNSAGTYQRETGGPTTAGTYQRGTGEPTSTGTYQRETGGPTTGTYQRETGEPTSAGTYQRETGGPTTAGTYQRGTGEPTSTGTYQRETGGPTTGTYQRETGEPTSAGTYQRETGGPTTAGTYQRETGEPPSAGTYQRETGGPTTAGTYQRGTGEPTSTGTYQRETGGPTTGTYQGDREGVTKSILTRTNQEVDTTGGGGALGVTMDTGVVSQDGMMEGAEPRALWTLNGRPLRRGGERGGALRLPALRLADAGNYTCHRAGRLISTVAVSVGVPPEMPTLSCHLKSHTSNIRCHWMASRPVTPPSDCYLLVKKGGFLGEFSRVKCTYSVARALCWCVLDREEGDKTLYVAKLCVTNTAGNLTSSHISFTPQGIIKPDPPVRVQVHGVKGREHTLGVSWAYPLSWKAGYYLLKFQLRYHPLQGQEDQVVETESLSWMIEDAMPGTQYELQLRARDEFDGSWSDWSKPAYAHTWTAPEPTAVSDFDTSLDTLSLFTEGSGDESGSGSGVEVENAGVMWVHVFWVFGCCVLLTLILLSTYSFRHRVRFMSKLGRLCGTPPPPPSQQSGDEAKSLVPPLSPTPAKDTPQHVLQGEEVDQEGIHLQNIGYFLVQN